MYLEGIINTVFNKTVLLSFDIAFYIYDFILSIALSLKSFVVFLSIVVPWYVWIGLILIFLYIFFKFLIRWK